MRCGISARPVSGWAPSGSDSDSARTASTSNQNPGEQGVLTEIRHLPQSGHTLRGVAAALNRKALRTRRGSAWRLEHVARISKQTTGPR
jgi:hypothetical protein